MLKPPKSQKKPFFTPLRKQVYILIFFNILLFANTLTNRFTYDDVEYIIRNPYVQEPGKFFALFTHPYPPHNPQLSLYRPLVEVTYLLDWCRSLRPSEFADLNFNDRVEMLLFHLTNIAFHVGAVLVLFFVVRRLFRKDMVAFVTALIFSAHPVHVEVVTSLVGRAESMGAFFCFVSLLLFVREYHKEHLYTPFRILSYISFFAALLSKESAITLPPIMLLTDWFMGTRERARAKNRPLPPDPCPHFSISNFQFSLLKSALIRLLPYGAVFLCYLIIRLRVVEVLGILRSQWYFGKEGTLQRLAAMCVGGLVYVHLLVFPLTMSADYNFPVRIFGPVWVEQPHSILEIWSLIGLAFVIVYGAITVWAVVHKKEIAYPLLFIPITIFPFSNIIPFGDFIAERFLYLPSAGYCLLVGILYARLRSKKRYARAALIGIIIILSFYSVRTIMRNHAWHSGISLWLAEFKQNPRNPNIYSSLGAVYGNARKDHLVKGNAYRAKGDFIKSAHHLELAREYEDKALKNLEMAVKKAPHDFASYTIYAMLCGEKRNPDLDKAEEALLRAATCMPENFKTLYVIYYYLGSLYLKREPPRPDKALKFLLKAEHLKHSSKNIQNAIARALGAMQRYDESLKKARAILARDPASKEAVKTIKLIRRDLLKK